MCGIAGFIGFRDDALLHSMTGILSHRGPDDVGYYADDSVSFGFRRLSIIDLETGNQPIPNEDRTVWVVYNGEIYNFAEIKAPLIAKGHRFATKTDTEVIVHAYEEEGIDCVRRFNGMFAFALWDVKQRTLYLVRDRLGKKPMHYLLQGERLWFASEMKALLKIPGLTRTVDKEAIDDFLTLRYVPGSGSLFKEIQTLEPAHILRYKEGRVTLKRYWQLEMSEPAEDGYRSDQYLEQFDELFRRSIQRRLVSDVPVGVYLSGGIDSTLVACYMREQTRAPIASFSHGFDGENDELKYARHAAERYHLKPHERLIRQEDLNLLKEIIYHMDMPIANSDVIGFYLLAKMARGNVKVVLAGEGADEVMGSYIHQQVLSLTHPVKQRLPEFFLQKVMSPLANAAPLALLNPFFAYPGYSMDRAGQRKIADFWATKDLADSYFSLNSLFGTRDKLELYTRDFAESLRSASPCREELIQMLRTPDTVGILNRLIAVEYRYWLPTYCLLKEDKIAMSQGIEQRYPFLDHELVEFAARIPSRLKQRGTTRKVLIRQLARRKIPEAIARRQKGPILVPIRRCFGNHFIEFANAVLTEEAVRRRGYFNYGFIRRLFDTLSKHPFLAERQLFSLVTLELWHQIFVDNAV